VVEIDSIPTSFSENFFRPIAIYRYVS